jgi:hypothetical protein
MSCWAEPIARLALDVLIAAVLSLPRCPVEQMPGARKGSCTALIWLVCLVRLLWFAIMNEDEEQSWRMLELANEEHNFVRFERR